VRAWALRDTRAHRVLARVDKKRVDYLTQIYAAQTGDESKARQLGQLEYAAFVGAQQLFTDLSTREARELEAALHRAMQLLAQDR
ncbi:MAG TPA: TetR/AcrR family transcriptional regulator, partial [Polyangiaceae bacterium]|nr:TetR/AcrR family transcriptional regulator [Polyangiaceae bacterium]